jgi:pSer/pThr/pTyr-binding forkhead associated (FHA) protein
VAKSLDVYHVWLGIPPEDQPPHHYCLLGIPLWESDAQVIAMAAQRQMAHVKTFSIGPHCERSQEILNELARAKVCLLNPKRRALYDAALRAKLRSQDRDWIVGSAAGCDVVVDQPTVSKRHCRLSQTARGCFLEDLGSTNGTFLNDRRVVSRPAVCRLDEVRLGRSVLMPWPAEIPAATARLIRIGAASDNDVVLDLPMISRNHAIIRLEEGAAILQDLDSTNGTAIDSPSSRIRQAPLSAEQTVYFGSHAVPAAKLLEGRGD